MQWTFNKLVKLRPQHLGISEILSLDADLRAAKMPSSSDPDILEETIQPYFKTIERLMLIMKLECPLTKLDVIFRIFTEVLSSELNHFWHGNDFIFDREMYIDSNTLRMLMVYVLVQTQSSKLKIDFDLVQEFTPQVLKFTNRSYYITLLQSAFEYIDDMTDTRVLELMERADSQQSCLPLLNKDKIDDKREKYHKTNSNGCLIIDKLLAVEEEAKMKKIIKMK